jgi:hypothetical protein
VASIGIIGIISSCIVHLITMHELHSGHLRTIFVGISEPLNPLPAGRASWSNINGEKSQQPTAISCFTKKRNSMLLLLFAHIYMHHASAAQKHWSNMKHGELVSRLQTAAGWCISDVELEDPELAAASHGA